jgi:uncharacterized protein (DUF2141 family)
MLSPNEDAPIYFYPLWKQKYLQGDVNYDEKVDARDIGIVCKAFGSSPNTIRWCFRADINNDRKIDAKDIGLVCKQFGKKDP